MKYQLNALFWISVGLIVIITFSNILFTDAPDVHITNKIVSMLENLMT